MSVFYTIFSFFFPQPQLSASFYDFEIPGLDIKEEHQAILLVNIASQCRLASQLADLEKLYQIYKNHGLLIVGVPSSDFLSQEPLEDHEIPQYCQLHYGVSFPIAKKSHVHGQKSLPLYQWLGQHASVKWNYHKYLFDKKGDLVTSFWPTTSPLSSKILGTIDDLRELK
jgi:glutathione peroxidase